MVEIVGPLSPYYAGPKATTEIVMKPETETLEGRLEWLKVRRSGLGSSDASAVLGLGRTTPHTLWLDKTGQMPFDLADSEVMFWGRKMEPTIREVTAERLGVDFYLPPMLRSREYPWMLSNLDGAFIFEEHDLPDSSPVVDEFGRAHIPFEAKNQTEWLRMDWSDGQVPDHAELQIHHSMIVLGAPYGYVAGLLGGNRLVVRRIDRDPALHAHMIEEERRFWHDYVLDGNPPPITYRDSVDTILGAAEDTDVATKVLTEEEAAVARDYLAQMGIASAAIKAAEETKREASNNLVAMAGWHELLVDPDGHPIIRLQRGVFAKKRFEEDHPDIADVTMKKIETLDIDALKAEHPDLYRKYQARSVRKPTKKDLAAAARLTATDERTDLDG